MHRHIRDTYRHIRAQESAAVRDLLEQRHSVALVGRHGMGKTTLLSGLAADFGDAVVHIPCNSTESEVRLSGLAIAAAALLGSGHAEAEAHLEAALSPELAPVEAADRLVQGIRAMPELRAALLVVDGVDEMDEASQEVMGHLLRRLSGTSVQAVVAARRIGEDSPLRGIPTVELTPLDRPTSVELAYALAAGPLCADAALTAANAAGGNPLALGHILEMMTERQRRGEAPFPRPIRTSDVAESFTRETLGELGAEARHILRILALAPLTEALALQQRCPQLWEELVELQARGVIEREGPYLRIADALVRSSLHWGMAPASRAGLREEAESAESSDGPLPLWHRSFRHTDADTAGDLLRAARGLVRNGHPDAAVEFAERALMLANDPAEEADGLLALAECLSLHGDSVFADRYVRFARASDRTAVQLRALRITVQIEFYRSQRVPSSGVDLWSAEEMAQAPDEAAAAQVVLALARMERSELAEAAALLTAAAEHVVLAEGAEARPSASRTILECAQMLFDAHRGLDRRALESLRGLAAPERSQTAVFAALTTARALTLTEHYGKARSVFELLEHRLPRTCMWKRILPMLRVDLEVRAGEFQQLAEFVAQARRRQQRDMPLREDHQLLLECRLLYLQGRPSDAEECEQRLVRLAGSVRNRTALAQLSALQGTYLLQSGLPAEALRHLQRCDELLPPGLGPGFVRHEPALIEALFQVGRREHAALLLQRFRARLERFPSRWGELSAQRCEALLETGERSLELFRRSLRTWKPEDSDHEKARTTAAYAVRLRELGALAQAREQQAAAAALFRGAGDLLQADGLTPAPAAAPPREAPREHPLLAQLSEEERAVVELVREGCRNREIADRVFVSLRTVEIRLTSVYRRFGVRSRTELLAALAHTGATVPA
jgi:DNA-binding CsgD family transcriptional regulator